MHAVLTSLSAIMRTGMQLMGTQGPGERLALSASPMGWDPSRRSMPSQEPTRRTFHSSSLRGTLRPGHWALTGCCTTWYEWYGFRGKDFEQRQPWQLCRSLLGPWCCDGYRICHAPPSLISQVGKGEFGFEASCFKPVTCFQTVINHIETAYSEISQVGRNARSQEVRWAV